MSIIRFYFVCLFALCSASVSALRIAFLVTVRMKVLHKWETCQIFKDDGLLVRV
jgi:hypothetical protein